MITKDKFKELRTQVDEAVEELIEHAKHHSQNNDFIVFVAKSEYLPENEGTDRTLWASQYELESIQENDTTNFLLEYLNRKYQVIQETTKDSKNDIILELMLYTHMWESTNHIKLLRRLAILCSGQPYLPFVSVPDNTRYTFIKEQIRDIFENAGIKMYDIIKRCYKSQFRNAFAHNDFSLSNDSIIFNNYRLPSHPYETLRNDEWTEIFILSALIKTSINNKVYEYSTDFKDGDSFDVTLRHDNIEQSAVLTYNVAQKQFYGKLK